MVSLPIFSRKNYTKENFACDQVSITKTRDRINIENCGLTTVAGCTWSPLVVYSLTDLVIP